MKAIVNVYLKNGVLDPQGKAVGHALDVMGFDEVKGVRIGKQVILDLEGLSKEEAQKRVDEMAQTLLANTVIEEYTIEIVA
jgi:phosphoribosylformylglycinamidine synthase